MPESLGKILKRARESKHLSLEDVSERSRIPKHIVSTIEDDRLGEIKPVFYAKSFVKTYAVFLGALNEPGVKEYLSRNTQEPQKKQEIVLKPAPKTHGEKIDFSGIAKYKNQMIAIIIGIFALWVLSLAIGQAVKFVKNRPVKKHEKTTKVKKEASKKTEKEKPGDAIAVKDVKKDASGGKSSFVELEIFASDNTWLQVTGDGEIVFTGLFKKGGKDIWKAKKEIKLEAGNSGVVKINVNGKPADFSGKKGEKKEIIITKDGIK
ncbi:MAG: DUF4115 domain-containing protein [Candidatus Omnitrophota bacterium]|nr:DUF4115 domain-containing protein [Candidatus Omnitrophota bacterium]